MSNFTIKFANPWFLLLLIPAILFTLVPYFRMNKRYRRTRNRITSMVLHIVVMVLTISVLSGATFEYDLPNEETEVILLVDTSDSNKGSTDDKDDFVRSIIENADDMFKLGIVKFGYDQVYAVELSNDTEDMYSKYLQAPSPNNTATDIASALYYAASLFENKKTARIVLISDALETDGKAINAIKEIAGKEIKVDTVSFPNPEIEDEVQILSLEFPDSKIKLGEVFKVKVTLQSSYSGKATLTPYDKNSMGEETGDPIEIDLVKGIQTVSVPYAFAIPGLHNISVQLESDKDNLTLNNSYTSYIDIQSFDKILIIESISDESESLRAMLDPELKVTVVNVRDELNMPATVNELRAYDQIILCNIAYKDMPLDFDEKLHSYVYDFGGGLFTICGNEEDLNPDDDDWTANAYTQEDMMGTTYQKLLPVEIIEYTPPAAVIIIIDKSGSMTDKAVGPRGETALDYAKQGAISSLDALSERDFVGIMSFGDDYEEEIELTPRPQRAKILSAIERIVPGGNTIFTTALKHAGDILAAKTGVQKRHIILVTDGQPTDNNAEDYKKAAEENAARGITMSIVGVECYGEYQVKMKELLTRGGMTEENLYVVSQDEIKNIPTLMRKDLEVPAIRDINYETFQPTFGTTHNITSDLIEEEMPTLDGFYGVKPKEKEGAEVVILGEYSPIYTQWQYGLGKVGTFACDLNGTWSLEFINSAVGAALINNIVEELFPTRNVQPDEIDSLISGDNYSTVISIFTDLNTEEGEYIELTITSPAGPGYPDGEIQTIKPSGSSYSRVEFAVKTPGLHEIVIEKKDEDGNLIASSTTYKALGYSKEYDMFVDAEAAEQAMIDYATFGRGVVIEQPSDVFDNVVKFLHVVINPKILFTIIALCLLLLDIAARKFKWKWPHELFGKKKITKK